MTTPLGDLPDWQTLTTPQILAASILDQLPAQQAIIHGVASPFRVWGLWVRLSVATSSAYVTAVNELTAKIVDGNLAPLLEVAVHVEQAGQIAHAELAIPIPGFTPPNSGATFIVQLVSSSAPANIFYRCSGGVFYSNP